MNANQGFDAREIGSYFKVRSFCSVLEFSYSSKSQSYSSDSAFSDI